MGFSRQEYWSGLPFSSPEDLPDSGIELRSPALQADSLPTELQGKPRDKDDCVLMTADNNRQLLWSTSVIQFTGTVRYLYFIDKDTGRPSKLSEDMQSLKNRNRL